MLDLRNDCAPLAACAASQLTKHGVPNRIIRVIGRRGKERNRHVVVVFECNGRVRAYDCMGTVAFPKGIKLSDSATKLAKAYGKHNGYEFKVVRGENF